MESIAESVQQLEEKERCRIDDLCHNETFIDTVMQATQAAVRTSQQEKREALRNAVLNAALPDAPDESRQQIFVNWVDSLTVLHLRMLRLFADPLSWYKAHDRKPPTFTVSSSLSALLTDAYPELKNEQPLYDKVAKDLYNEGLIGTQGIQSMMSAQGAFEKRATDLGSRFLKFISDPGA